MLNNSDDIKSILREDFKAAMLSKNTIKKNCIQMVRASILQTEKDLQKELSFEDIINIISKQIKQKKDALEQFEKANRDDLIKLTNREINILEEYMPEQLSIEEVKKIVVECRTELGNEGNNIRYFN